jgi:urea carboxylase
VFNKVLIANRGEIACRVIRTLNRLGVASVAVHSEADEHSKHVALATEALCIGPAPARESYLSSERVIEAALRTGAQAVHPGYGFLSENAEFAEACEARGLVFIGPTPEQMRRFGLKHEAREIAERERVPLLPGTGLLSSAAEALNRASVIGYPVMIKSTAGGGGIGLQRCETPEELEERFIAVERLSKNSFGRGGVFLEKFVRRARHVEVQIFGDGSGTVATLGERDCSAQRRNQKVIEETPAPHLPEHVRQALWAAAKRLAEAVRYRSAGTVEFLYDADSEAYYFLEVNTRLQVEHGVTELVAGVDLVEWMLRLAAGESLPLAEYVHAPRGHAIQARIYAEDPAKGFQPSAGLITEVSFPEGLRVDHFVEAGMEVVPFYDPLLAKLMVHRGTREAACEALVDGLAATRLAGIETNLEYLTQIAASETFSAGQTTTAFLQSFTYQPHTVDVLESGLSTTIQDHPGRLGFWGPGIPPSGPMDDWSFRVGNRAVGNAEGTAGLEITLTGPTLRFNTETVFCLTGAAAPATLDGELVEYWVPVRAAAGAVLRMGALTGPGARAYLLVQGGFDVPVVMGSRSTFVLGGIGGHGGRTLRPGDVLRVSARPEAASSAPVPQGERTPLTSDWEIGVVYGPHGAPEFFTPEDIRVLFEAEYEVHFNSDRTGVRLIGPKPAWARSDGGDAGLHPSNIHDTMYSVGAIDFTGDMPILLGPDGPSQGGFVCPAVVARAERWKLGQLRAGDRVRFRCLNIDEAIAQHRVFPPSAPRFESAAPVGLPDVFHRVSAEGERPALACRFDGDGAMLAEYGPNELDLVNRLRVQLLMRRMQELALHGVEELCPAVRSLQVLFDARVLPPERLARELEAADRELPSIDEMAVRSRIVHLPLSWDDPQARLAATRYTQGVRPNAPWCPSNIEFIRRINGLKTEDDVRAIVYGARYLVLGLGNVYLGAPCTTPLDPRHRLVTTKYNPARTWTPENAVGIGGAYLGIYGMEGPGGYQLVGRTCQIYNRYRVTRDFPAGKPWLLDYFDQVRFYPVTAEELLVFRDRFPQGKVELEVEEETFRLADYRAFLQAERSEIDAFRASQRAAFAAERQRWIDSGELGAQAAAESATTVRPIQQETALPPGAVAVRAPVHANVWALPVAEGTRVRAGDKLVVLEAMKTEIAVTAPADGVLESVLTEPGRLVRTGEILAVLRP